MVLESAIATPAIALNQIVGISLTTALLIAASLSATDLVLSLLCSVNWA